MMGCTCSLGESDVQPTVGTIECWKVPGDLLTQLFSTLAAHWNHLESLSNSGT